MTKEPARPRIARFLTAVRFFTAEDIAWILLFTILILCQEDIDYNASLVLAFLACFQVAEPKIAFFKTRRGQIISPLVKLFLCYLVVGWAHGINSTFYVIFLLPIVTAATELDLLGTMAVIVLACLAYASFLLFINWDQADLPALQIRLLCLRISFFPVVGLMVYQQARAKREEMTRTKAAAEQLAESNRSLRRAQASLRRSERLAALGQLTAGLAHELRNPLGTIKASAELLNRRSTLEHKETVEELAGYITSEVDRTNGLVSRFLDFARPLELHAKRSDIRETADESAAQVRQRADGKDVRIRTKLPEHALEFNFDPDLIQVVLVNLLQNAVDASAPNHSVTLAVTSDDDLVHISVSDEGTGIAPEHLENIFNPFFTTKSTGTGLGLALVAKIVDEHQGKIAVQSSPGTGTTFEILLPRTLET